MPETVQLVLSTRTDPALPLSTLRARGQLLELRADDLRFSVAEAEEFLNGRLGLGLSTPDIELLVARTEGWPAGIYLAALSLAGSDDRHGLVRAFDGTTAHVVDFLATEVLAAHGPDLQRFMLRTSVLERLCAPLCRAVLGEPGSSRALEELARTNLFLLPLDDRGRWFRFHHLFALILRVELERREPGLVPELHRRAYEWHAEHGTADEAIHHAVSAGAFPEAGGLIAESWVHYANVGRTASVSEWLRRFPDPIIDADARLLLVKAWVAALRGRQDAMRAAVARVRELGGLDEGPLPDGFASLESSLSVLTATFGWGDAPGIIEHGMRSAELEGPDSPWRPVITWAVGWAHLCHDDLDEAERWLRETTELAPNTNQWIVGVAAIADLSLIAGMRGDRGEQMRLALEAAGLAREVGLTDAVEDGEVHTALGVALACEAGRLERQAHLRAPVAAHAGDERQVRDRGDPDDPLVDRRGEGDRLAQPPFGRDEVAVAVVRPAERPGDHRPPWRLDALERRRPLAVLEDRRDVAPAERRVEHRQAGGERDEPVGQRAVVQPAERARPGRGRAHLVLAAAKRRDPRLHEQQPRIGVDEVPGEAREPLGHRRGPAGVGVVDPRLGDERPGLGERPGRDGVVDRLVGRPVRAVPC